MTESAAEFNTLVLTLGFIANFLAIVSVGWKISSFLARIEVKVDTLWAHHNRQVRESD